MFRAPKALACGDGSPEGGPPPGLEVGMASWGGGCVSWVLKDKWDKGLEEEGQCVCGLAGANALGYM